MKKSSEAPLKILKGFRYPPSLQFSPDGNILAGCNDRIQLWNIHTGKILHRFKSKDHLRAHAFSHDGSHLYSTTFGKFIRCWDIGTGSEIASVPINGNMPMAYITVTDRHVITIPDSGTYGTTGMVFVWDLAMGQWHKTLDTGVKGTGAMLEQTGFHISTNGQFVAVWGGTLGKKTAVIWDLWQEKEICRWSVPDAIYFVRLSWDAKQIITVSERTDTVLTQVVRVWQRQALQPIESFVCDQFMAIDNAVFLSDGVRLAFGVAAPEHCGIVLYDFHTGQNLHFYKWKPFGRVCGLAVSPDDRWLAGGDEDIGIWELLP